MKCIKFFFLFSFILISQINSVENSIMWEIEKYENISNLPKDKYSKAQYKEIEDALSKLDERIRVVSFNVLFAKYDHNLEEINRWPVRHTRVIEAIKEMRPDVMGVQELYQHQLEDIMPQLEDEFTFFAYPFDDNERNGIFYRTDRFEVIESKVMFMTETPEIPAPETLTILCLRDNVSGKSFAIMNVHLSFSKIEKREFQAKFIAREALALSNVMPVVLTGDLNTFPNRLDVEYPFPFLDGDHVHRILTKEVFKDAREQSLIGHLGPLSTFTNIPGNSEAFQGTGTPGVFLDHVYVSKGIQVIIHAVQHGTVKGSFPSDHMPVVTDIILDEPNDLH